MKWPNQKFTLLLFVAVFLVFGALAAAAGNLLVAPWADQPLSYENNPVVIESVADGFTFTIAAEPGASFVWADKSKTRAMPTNPDDYIVGLGMNPIGDSNTPFLRDQSMDKMPIGRYLPDIGGYQFVVHGIPVGQPFRLNLPAWVGGGRPNWRHPNVFGWISYNNTGKFYTVDPSGENNGYALVLQADGKFYPAGRGNIARR